MHPSPLISIVTVTYNAESELPITLKSISSQTFHNFEHIVVDGASSDNTVPLVKDAAIPNSFLISEPDKGLYDAMNKALDLASGEYILFLNAGDAFYDDTILAKYARAAENLPDIIYGDTVIVNVEGDIIGKRHLSVPQQLEFRSFAKGMLICHQAFMVKRELTGKYDLSYRFSADYDWCVECIRKSSPEKCVNLNTATIRFLQAGISDKNKIKSLKERFRIMCRHYGFMPTLTNHLLFAGRAIKRKKL